MPNFPDELYYKKRSVGVTYTTLPTGNPDISRALCGKDNFWLQPDGEEDLLAPKVLVLDVNELCQLEIVDKVEILSIKLPELLSAGFELYFFYEGNIHEITTETLKTILIYVDVLRDPLALDYKDKAKKALALSGVESEAIFFLDFDNLHLLLPDDSETKVKLGSESQLSDFKKKEKKQLDLCKKLEVGFDGEIDVRWIVENLPNLRSLVLHGSLEGTKISYLLKSLKLLEELALEEFGTDLMKISSNYATDVTFWDIDKKLCRALLDCIKPAVTTLELCGGWKGRIPKDLVQKIISYLPNIKKITERENFGHEITGIGDILEKLKHVISYSGPSFLKDIRKLSSFISRLEYLSLLVYSDTSIDNYVSQDNDLYQFKSLKKLELTLIGSESLMASGQFLNRASSLVDLTYIHSISDDCTYDISIDNTNLLLRTQCTTLKSLVIKSDYSSKHTITVTVTIDLDFVLACFPNIEFITLSKHNKVILLHKEHRARYQGINIEYATKVEEKGEIRTSKKPIILEEDTHETVYHGEKNELPVPLSASVSSAPKVPSFSKPITRSIDANIREVIPTYDAIEYFTSLIRGVSNPHVSRYRLDIYKCTDPESAEFNVPELELIDAPTPYEIVDKPISPGTCILSDASSSEYYKGSIKLTIDERWQALPSLSPSESIIAIKIGNKLQEAAKKEFEIKYSHSQSLYYIRKKEASPTVHTCTVDILLCVHRARLVINPSSTEGQRIEYYKRFTAPTADAQVSLIKDAADKPKELLRLIRELQVGACRHRAMAFVAEFPEGSRLVTNHTHAFVEVKVSWQEEGELLGEYLTRTGWVTVDLGGYEASINVIKLEDSTPVPRKHADPVGAEDLKTAEYISEPDPAGSVVYAPISKTETVSQELLLDTVRKYLKPEHINPIPISSLDLTVCGEMGKNILILAEDSELIKINLYLHQALIGLGRPVYYIDSPDDLICSARWIKRESSVEDVSLGKVMSGPGGSFCEFLQANVAPTFQPVIIVNFNSENFATRDLIRFNSMIDEVAKRICDGIAVPRQAIIIGLYNHRSTKAYRGDDFYSRFEVHECTTQGVILPDIMRDDIFDEHTAYLNGGVVIDLMQSGQWKNILLGSWEFSDGLKLVDTTFIKALRRGEIRFHFLNPPKDSKELKDLLDLAKLKGKIVVHGVDVPIPEGFKVTSSTDLSLSSDKLSISNFEASDATAHIKALNPGTVEFFLKNFEITAGGDYKGLPGYIEATGKGQTCSILVTRTLSLVKWYQLIQTAGQYDVTLNIKVAAGVSLPEELQRTISIPTFCEGMGMGTVAPVSTTVVAEVESEDGMSILPDTSREMMPCTVVVTQDQDFALDSIMCSLGGSASSALIIDVTDYTVCDLLYNISLTTTGAEGISLKFSKKDCCVLDAIKSSLTVILKGKFKKELVDILAEYMLSIDSYPISFSSGKLIIITDNDLLFGFAKNKMQIDARTYSSSPHSFVQQKAIQNYKEIFPAAADMDTFAGLRKLPGDFYRLDDCPAEKLDKDRLDSVLKVLEKHPFVFLAGASGVGKTTFIDHVLSKDTRISAVFMGEQSIKAWADASGADAHKLKILFIDEANIAGRNWSEFEGLFQKEPYVIIDGKIHALTPNHKVIFAGNPLNYGGDRTLPSLFARHGHTLIFKPLSLNYIKQKVLEPVFAGVTGLAFDVQEKVTKLFLDVYRFFSEECKTLITSRELQMMALIFRARSTEIRLDDESSKQLALEIIGRVSRRFVPKEFLETFDAQFSITVAADVDDDMDAAAGGDDAAVAADDMDAAADDDAAGDMCTGSADGDDAGVYATAYGTDIGGMHIAFDADMHAGVYPTVDAGGTGIVSGTEDVGAAIMDPLASKQSTEDEEKDGMSHVSEEESSGDEKEVITGPLITSKQEKVEAYLSENEFLWTGAHLQLRPYLEDIFAVRAFKAEATVRVHGQEFGGLGGLIIEGEPGLGKSEAVIAFCKEKSIRIIHICASLQSDAKIKMLQEAYYKGAVVVIDEINSSPMLERLINDLLMGRLPAEWRAEATEITPGFTLIATQNPIYMAGRAATSTAVEHRTMKVVLEDYSLADAAAVLEKKYYLDSASSRALVQVYDEKKRRAISRGLWPVPNFRDLCKAAKKYAAYCHYQHYLEQGDSIYLCFAVKFGEVQAAEKLGDLYVQLGKACMDSDVQTRIGYYQRARDYYTKANCCDEKVKKVQEILDPPLLRAMKCAVARGRHVGISSKMAVKRRAPSPPPAPAPIDPDESESDAGLEPARKMPRHAYA